MVNKIDNQTKLFLITAYEEALINNEITDIQFTEYCQDIHKIDNE